MSQLDYDFDHAQQMIFYSAKYPPNQNWVVE